MQFVMYNCSFVGILNCFLDSVAFLLVYVVSAFYKVIWVFAAIPTISERPVHNYVLPSILQTS